MKCCEVRSNKALKYWTHFDQSEHLAHLKHEHFAFFFTSFQALKKLVITLKKCFLAQKHIWKETMDDDK